MNLKKLENLLEIAVRACHGAGSILTQTANAHFEIREKAPFDLVTTVDLAANEWIRSKLLSDHPRSMVLAEEDNASVLTVLKKARDCEVLWIVDPLDGTTNFAKRVPHVGISIAAYQPATKELLVGCIYDPWRKESFTAINGNGAELNGFRIKVSDVDNFHFALAATGFSYTKRRSLDNNLAELAPFVKKCLGFRRFGAASLDLAWIACSRLDIYWESGLKSWDVAAGILIVQEALGLCSNFDDAMSSPFDRTIVATNSKLHGSALSQIRRSRKKAGLS